MKYIRTKDTIFEVVAEDTKVFTVRAKHNRNHLYNKSKIQTDILKQADTIEEVCDDFIEVWGDSDFVFHSHIPIKNKRSMNEYNKYRKETNTIYGAIWTDKGLIYVAKMNKNGELELL